MRVLKPIDRCSDIAIALRKAELQQAVSAVWLSDYRPDGPRPW